MIQVFSSHNEESVKNIYNLTYGSASFSQKEAMFYETAMKSLLRQ